MKHTKFFNEDWTVVEYPQGVKWGHVYDWLKSYDSPGSYCTYFSTVAFELEQDAVMFMMKWGGGLCNK